MKTIREHFEDTLTSGARVVPVYEKSHLLDALERDVKNWLLDEISKENNEHD